MQRMSMTGARRRATARTESGPKALPHAVPCGIRPLCKAVEARSVTAYGRYTASRSRSSEHPMLPRCPLAQVAVPPQGHRNARSARATGTRQQTAVSTAVFGFRWWDADAETRRHWDFPLRVPLPEFLPKLRDIHDGYTRCRRLGRSVKVSDKSVERHSGSQEVV